MNRRSAVALVLSIAALLCGPAGAHGGAPHILGTVKAIDANTLTVETPKHKAVTVKLSATTRYEQGHSKVGPQSVKPGERVVVHTRREAGELVASEVHLAPTPSKHAAAAKVF